MNKYDISGGAAPAQAAVYIRIGSRSAGFILPDEREAFKAYMNQDSDEMNRNGRTDSAMQHITPDELRSMRNTEGLILQGCGGDPREWLDGVNKLLTEQGILLDGDTFKDVFVFEHDGRTNILFGMDDVKLDLGRLAMWRLQSHGTFGGTWLSDYLPNCLGVGIDAPAPAERQRPEAPIIGADGNIFNILGIAARALKESGMAEQSREMRSRVTESGGYDNALAVIMEYVEPVEAGGPNRSGMKMRM